MNELLMTAFPVAEITIIKRDFDLLPKLVLNLTNDIQTQMLPYAALFCYETIAYLKNMIQPFMWNKWVEIP